MDDDLRSHDTSRRRWPRSKPPSPTAQAMHGHIPTDGRRRDRRRVPRSRSPSRSSPMDGTSARPVLATARRVASAPATGSAGHFLHRDLTTQDVIDTATMLLVSDALRHLGELAARGRRGASGDHRTFRRRRDPGALVPATRRRDHCRLPNGSMARPTRPRSAQAGVGPDAGATRWADRRRHGPLRRRRHSRREQLCLRRSSPWHTDRSPVIAVVDDRHRFRPLGGQGRWRHRPARATRRDHHSRRRLFGGGRKAQPDRRDASMSRGREACLGSPPSSPTPNRTSWNAARQLACRVVRRPARVPDRRRRGRSRGCRAVIARRRAIGAGRSRRSPRCRRRLRRLRSWSGPP